VDSNFFHFLLRYPQKILILVIETHFPIMTLKLYFNSNTLEKKLLLLDPNETLNLLSRGSIDFTLNSNYVKILFTT
jgi:hypothetical protein